MTAIHRQTRRTLRQTMGNKQAADNLLETLDFLYGAGNIRWVDSGSGSDGAGSGLDIDTPFASINYAFSNGGLTANNGDVVVVLPGHAETVSAAGGLDLDVAGVRVIGIGDGAATPTVTLDTAVTADVDVSAANITIENIHFKSAFADINHCIDVNAQNCTIRNCRFTEDADNENFLICILGATSTTSNGLTVEDCYCLQDDASNTHFVSLPGTSKGDIIRNNVILGDFGTAAIGAAGIVTFCTVMDNVIYNAASDNDSCINMHASATGIVMRNLAGGAAAQANGITATACAVAENYYGVISEDLSAILDPIAT